jgi:hypothetical protein
MGDVRCQMTIAIWMNNKSPENTGGTDFSSDIGFDILGIRPLKPETLQVYLDGSLIFQGPNTFLPPFNGASSSIIPILSGGYEGFGVVLGNTENLNPDTAYLVVVNCEDIDGETFTIDNTFSFTTENIIESVGMGPYEITIDVTFSGNMSPLEEIQSSANYIFNNGAYARKVDLLESLGDSAKKIRLWVELLYGYDSFTLRLNPKLLDQQGYPIVRDFVIEPFHSTANISNYNGRVRTWRESEFVQADSQRIYLAGLKGIDVFRKQTKVNPVRWAQIFDGCGISAMFVANYGGDYVFSDIVPPYLKDQVPLPGGTAHVTDPICFSIADLTTAVEIPSVLTYVNNLLVFKGSVGGWYNGFSGNISIGFKKLEFRVVVPVGMILPDTTVSVRVIATDLLGNMLDTTYTFTTIA